MDSTCLLRRDRTANWTRWGSRCCSVDWVRVRTVGRSTSKAVLEVVLRDSRASDIIFANSLLNSSSISGSILRFLNTTSCSSSSSGKISPSAYRQIV